MANNIQVTQGTGTVMKTTEVGGVHTPHSNIDSLPTDPLGATADLAVVTDTTGTLSGKLRGLVKWAFERMPASLGQKAKAASLPVTLATDEDNINTDVQSLPGTVETDIAAIKTAVELLDNTVSGTEIQADVLTIPSTAVEGGALPAVVTVVAGDDGVDTHTLQTTATGLLKVDGSGATQPVSGTVTANAGTGPWPVTDNSGSLTVDAANDGSLNVTIGDGTNTATIRNLAANDSLNVAIVDGAGDQITSFGGGVQYTEGDTDATITGTAVMWEDTADTLKAASAANPLPVNVVSGAASGTEYTEGDTDPTIAGPAVMWEDTGNTLRPVSAATPFPVEIIAGAGSGGTAATDDSAFTPGTTNVTPAGAMFDDVTPDSVDEGDVGVVRMSANRNLYVTLRDAAGNERGVNVDANGDIGVTLPGTAESDLSTLAGAVSGTEMQVDVLTSALPTGASTAANQTTANTALSAIQTAVELIDNTVSGTELQVDVITSGLPTGAATAANQSTANTSLSNIQTAVELIDNAISGSEMQVDVVASLPTGSNTIGAVDVNAPTSGGYSIMRSIDLDETEEAVKASAGQVFGYYIYNANASNARFVKFYNATVATVVVGTTTPVLTIPIPPASAANVSFPHGIAFDTAITVAATTAVADADTGAPSANDVVVNIFYK